MYSEKIKGIDEIVTPFVASYVTRMSWFVYVIRLSDEFTRYDRDNIVKEMGKKGIQTRNYFAPIHLQPFYMKEFGFKKGDFPITEFVSDRTIALPFYTEMDEREVNHVVENLKDVIREAKRGLTK